MRLRASSFCKSWDLLPTVAEQALVQREVSFVEKVVLSQGLGRSQ